MLTLWVNVLCVLYVHVEGGNNHCNNKRMWKNFTLIIEAQIPDFVHSLDALFHRPLIKTSHSTKYIQKTLNIMKFSGDYVMN